MAKLTRAMRKRSGNSLAGYMGHIGYTPKHITIAGVGAASENALVFREVWPDVEIFGFEPEPRAYRLATDKFPGRIWNCGLWSTPCTRSLYVKRGWIDGSSMYPNSDDQATRQEIQVQCTTLDSMLGLGPGGVLWLDCEGAELEALKGGEQFIKQIDVVNVELTTAPKGPWCTPQAVHEWLLGKGFAPMFIHTARPWAGQRDVIYGRGPAYCPNRTHFL